jgi:hypothetical protein
MNVSGRLALEMLAQGIRCWWEDRPLSVSFEITHYCTANCWHCNWGGPVKGEQRRTPEEYAAICREMRPVVVNISGGEPLARNDVCDVVRAMANPGHLPWMVLVSNAATLTEQKYHRLRGAGVNQFSISLDFPDERHSEFRRIPGLFDKMNRVIPQLTALGHGDVSLNSCITAWNFRDVPAMVELAGRWNTQMNLSVYTPIRVNDAGLPGGEALPGGQPRRAHDPLRHGDGVLRHPAGYVAGVHAAQHVRDVLHLDAGQLGEDPQGFRRGQLGHGLGTAAAVETQGCRGFGELPVEREAPVSPVEDAEGGVVVVEVQVHV